MLMLASAGAGRGHGDTRTPPAFYSVRTAALHLCSVQETFVWWLTTNFADPNSHIADRIQCTPVLYPSLDIIFGLRLKV